MSTAELCAQLIRKYTGRPIEYLLPFSSERPFGKTTQHHLRSNQFRPSIIPNTLQNVYTWCQVDMLTHLELTGNTGHFKLNFNEIRCWITSAMSSRTWVGSRTVAAGTYWAVTTQCVFCMELIIERSIWCKRVKLPSIDLYEHFKEARETVKEINKEIENFTPEMYLIPDQDDINVTSLMAAQAMCQNVCDAEWSNARVLEDSVVGHTISSHGMDVIRDFLGTNHRGLVDFEDLRYVPIRIIFSSVIPFVIGEITKRFPRATQSNIGVMLASIPALSLPWTSILYHLHRLHRNREMQDHVSRLLQESATIMDNYLTYSARFGAECYKYWIHHPFTSLEITVLTNRQDEHVRRTIKNRLNSYRRAIFTQYAKPLDDNRLSQEQRERNALELVTASCRYYAFEQEYTLTRGINNEILPTSLHVINLEDDFSADMYIHELTESMPDFIARVSRRFHNLPITQAANLCC